MTAAVSSCGMVDKFLHQRIVPFSSLSEDELRRRARQMYPDGGRADYERWTREMLHAFFYNRLRAWHFVECGLTEEVP